MLRFRRELTAFEVKEYDALRTEIYDKVLKKEVAEGCSAEYAFWNLKTEDYAARVQCERFYELCKKDYGRKVRMDRVLRYSWIELRTRAIEMGQTVSEYACKA